MTEEKFTWKGYEWETHERWGYIHPDKPWAVYSKDCVSVDRKGNLVLNIGRSSNGVYPMGLVSSTKNNPKFGFGTYVFEAKLPKGKHLWPALWMWSWDAWPPELDVMEALTNRRGTYLMGDFKTMDVTNCYHFDADDSFEADHLKLKNCWYCLPQCSFNEYSMEWLPDSINFYFNGKLIRHIGDRERLKWISDNCPNGMNVVMNIYPTKAYKNKEIKTPLIVRNFEYHR